MLQLVWVRECERVCVGGVTSVVLVLSSRSFIAFWAVIGVTVGRCFEAALSFCIVVSVFMLAVIGEIASNKNIIEMDSALSEYLLQSVEWCVVRVVCACLHPGGVVTSAKPLKA